MVAFLILLPFCQLFHGHCWHMVIASATTATRNTAHNCWKQIGIILFVQTSSGSAPSSACRQAQSAAKDPTICNLALRMPCETIPAIRVSSPLCSGTTKTALPSYVPLATYNTESNCSNCWSLLLLASALTSLAKTHVNGNYWSGLSTNRLMTFN